MLFELREHLGIVTNDLMAACTREISGRDLVLSAFFGSVGLWPHHEVTPDMERRAEVALEAMEVAHLAERTVNHLSSGESRRLLIARALAHQPRALVLDEPTNSLDLRACRDLTASLRRLAQQGTNIILVTHHLPDIIPEIGRVVALKDGRVFRDGHRRGLDPGVLSEVFGVPVDVDRHAITTSPSQVDAELSALWSCLTSSSDSSRSAAPTMPSSCSARRAPTMAAVTAGWRRLRQSPLRRASGRVGADRLEPSTSANASVRYGSWKNLPFRRQSLSAVLPAVRASSCR